MGAVADLGNQFIGAVTGSTGADAAQAAGAMQASAAGQGIGEITAGREQALGFLAPFQQVGQQGLDMAGFLTDPRTQFSYLQNNPLFQMAVEAGQGDVLKSSAARGRMSAGDTMQELSKSVLLAASPLIQSQSGNIMDLLRMGTGVAGQQAGVVTDASRSISDLIGSRAAAQAAGRVGSAQAQTSGMQNLLTAGLTAGAIFSDHRLKTDIKFIRKENGFNLYSWTWNILANALFGLKGSSFGVLAHEVKEKCPDAISYDRGYMKVDYSMIGVPYGN